MSFFPFNKQSQQIIADMGKLDNILQIFQIFQFFRGSQLSNVANAVLTLESAHKIIIYEP